MPMKYSIDITPILRSGASFDHVINISSPVPSEQESIPLQLCSLQVLGRFPLTGMV
jgi:hypothetical protein